MELSIQIKKYRAEMGLSQEELAEKVFVSRQTISNWENDKNYPDVHSLILLSHVFEISLDQLIKGDVKMMKEEIKTSEIQKYSYYGKILVVLMVIMIGSAVPLAMYLEVAGLAIWAVIAAVAMFYAVKVEKIKKDNNLHTYKTVVAFLEGKRLDELEDAVEKAKKPYENVLWFLGSAAVSGLIVAILFFVLK